MYTVEQDTRSIYINKKTIDAILGFKKQSW